MATPNSEELNFIIKMRDQASATLEAFQSELRETGRAANETDRGLRRAGEGASSMLEAMEDSQRRTRNLSSAFRDLFGEAFSLAQIFGELDASGQAKTAGALSGGVIGVSVTAAVGASIAQFGIIESRLLEVGQAMDAARGQIANLRDELTDLNTETTSTANELAGIAGGAASAGVRGNANLQEFSEQVGLLREVTQFQEGEAVRPLQRLLNFSDSDVDDLRGLVSVITELGDNVVATSPEIVEMGVEVQKMLRNMEPQRALALSAAMSEIGVDSGQAVSVIQQLQRVAEEGGNRLQVLADVLGTTTQEARNLVESNPARAMVEFADGVTALQRSGQDANAVLESLDFTGDQTQRTLQLIGSNTDEVNAQFRSMQSALDGGSEALKQMNQRSDTLIGSLEKLLGALQNIGTEIGENFAPSLRASIQDLTERINEIERLISNVEQPEGGGGNRTPNLLTSPAAIQGLIAQAIGLPITETLRSFGIDGNIPDESQTTPDRPRSGADPAGPSARFPASPNDTPTPDVDENAVQATGLREDFRNLRTETLSTREAFKNLEADVQVAREALKNPKIKTTQRQVNRVIQERVLAALSEGVGLRRVQAFLPEAEGVPAPGTRPSAGETGAPTPPGTRPDVRDAPLTAPTPGQRPNGELDAPGVERVADLRQRVQALDEGGFEAVRDVRDRQRIADEVSRFREGLEERGLSPERIRELSGEFETLLTRQAELREQATGAAGVFEDAWSQASNTAAQAFGQFVATGEADMQRLVSTITGQLAELGANRVFRALLDGEGLSLSGGSNLLSDIAGFGSQALSLFGGGGGGGTSVADAVPAFNDKGGIVEDATFFRDSRQGFGVAGERRREGILPLERTASGDLGVKANTGGNTVNVGSVVVNMERQEGEDDEETGRRIGEEVRRQLEGMMVGTIQGQQRPGGTLNPTTEAV